MLTGRTTTHLRTFNIDSQKSQQNQRTILLHTRAIKPFLHLKMRAKKEGFNLQIVSAFRSYERQLSIWNDKVQGKRDLWNHEGTAKLSPETLKKLTPKELLLTIMRWSAFPGCSRHHWGSDIDIYDASSLPLSQVQLLSSETTYDAPMGDFYRWLDDQLKQDRAEGFFRPYEEGHSFGDLAPERWHLSFRPVANRYLEKFSFSFFTHFLHSLAQNAPPQHQPQLLPHIQAHAQEMYSYMSG